MPKHLLNQSNASASDTGRLLDYQLTPISDLKTASRNARKHSKRQVDALSRSVSEFGIVSPVIRDSENRIVAGHGRVEAARKLGLKAIPTLLLDGLSEPQIRLYALADNAIAERATWDEKTRAEEFRDLRFKVPDLDLTLSGIEHPVIELAIAGLEQSNWNDLDNCPEVPPAVPVSRRGDTWDYAGGHTVVCGDNTDRNVVEAALRGESVQLVATDPPFNRAAKEYGGKGHFANSDFRMAAGEMSQDQFRAFLASSFEAVRPYLADGALVFSFMDGKHIGDLVAAGERVGFAVKDLITWDKGVAGLGGMYRHACEYVVLFKHGKARHVNNIIATRGQGRDRQTIWRYPGINRFGKRRERALSLHATIKPVELLIDLMLDASNPGDIVYDGFGGSGSTLLAAAKIGRRARLVEIEEKYCDVIIERFRLAFGEEPVERNTGLSFTELAALRAGSPIGETDDGR